MDPNKSSYCATMLLLMVFSTGLCNLTAAQDQPGSAPGQVLSDRSPQADEGVASFIIPEKMIQEGETTFNTTVFTFGEIVIFAYANDTEITILNQEGETVLNRMLQKDEFVVQQSSSGIYRIFGSKSFTALVGDATTSAVHGWYAVDQSGRGTSTLFNTYMMRQTFAGQEKFIVAAYEDNTDFTIRNLDTGELLHAGVIHSGEFFTMPNTPLGTFLQVAASKPVSALSYGDTDYYVPSSNGTFAGTLFLGYSAFIGNWTNSITVTGYHDDTQVTVINTVTGEIIAEYTLNEGQVNSQPVNSPTYWRLESNKPVVAANIPYAGWTGNYYYKTRAIDINGIGAGKLFYMPTIGSRIDVFSFDNDNTVKIELLGRDDAYPYTDVTTVYDGNLHAGEGYTFHSPAERNVYKIQGTGNVSVIQSNGGAGAEFMALSFAQELPDLAVSSDGISFSPEKETYQQGENIDITISVYNYGPVDAENVDLYAYDGDPDGDGVAPILFSEAIPVIAGHSHETVSFSYTVPPDPEFRQIVIKTDPEETIRESNSANNKASRFIIPNEDLLPPIAVTVDATAALQLDLNNELEPNPFTVSATLLNTGEGTAQNVVATLIVLDGLSIAEGPAEQNIGSLAPGQNMTLDWLIRAEPGVVGPNRYTIRVEGSNMDSKDVNRAVNIPLVAPANLTLTEVVNENAVQLSWSAHPVATITGFRVYRGSSRTDLSLLAEAGASTLTFKDTALQDGPAVYAISAVMESVESVLSNLQRYYYQTIPDEWMMISIPVQEAQITLEKSRAFSFNGAYQRDVNLTSLKGYWVKSSETEVLRSGGDPLSQVNLSLARGWNLIGSLTDPVRREVIQDAAGILSDTPIYYYDGITYVATTELEPGNAHWIHTQNAGNISMDVSQMSSTAKEKSSEESPVVPDCDLITFRTAGIEIPFLASADPIGERYKERFLMPPPAPEPVLEIRSSDDYRISDRPETELRLTSEHYPVTVELTRNKQRPDHFWRLEARDGEQLTFIDLVPGHPRNIAREYDRLILKRIPASEVIMETALEPGYPNPFNPVTTIRYRLTEEAPVNLQVYDMLGQRVAVLVQEQKQPGAYSVLFDATNLASGVYFLHLQTGAFSDIQKVTLIK